MLRKITTVLEMIKIQHAIFALPWAFVAALYALREVDNDQGSTFPVDDGPTPWAKFGWILLAMIAARSAALAFNRFADAKLDADNPRTAGRAIPKGRVSPAFTLAFAVVMAGLLVCVRIGEKRWEAMGLDLDGKEIHTDWRPGPETGGAER